MSLPTSCPENIDTSKKPHLPSNLCISMVSQAAVPTTLNSASWGADRVGCGVVLATDRLIPGISNPRVAGFVCRLCLLYL